MYILKASLCPTSFQPFQSILRYLPFTFNSIRLDSKSAQRIKLNKHTIKRAKGSRHNTTDCYNRLKVHAQHKKSLANLFRGSTAQHILVAQQQPPQSTRKLCWNLISWLIFIAIIQTRPSGLFSPPIQLYGSKINQRQYNNMFVFAKKDASAHF